MRSTKWNLSAERMYKISCHPWWWSLLTMMKSKIQYEKIGDTKLRRKCQPLLTAMCCTINLRHPKRREFLFPYGRCRKYTGDFIFYDFTLNVPWLTPLPYNTNMIHPHLPKFPILRWTRIILLPCYVMKKITLCSRRFRLDTLREWQSQNDKAPFLKC